MKRIRAVSLLIAAVMLLFMPEPVYTGAIEILPETIPLSGSPVEINISNAKDGYVMVRYLKATVKELRVIINGPGGKQYIYRLNPVGKNDVYPLSDGNGDYLVTVYEQVFGNKYSTVASAALNVRLSDEFAPFLRPNQYVNYSSGSKTAKKAAELTYGLSSTNDKIAAIYHYVTTNISYDQQLADTVQPGYLPDVDKVLTKGKGICFDYAALTAAMLRSQGIPAKLVIGYRDEIYHAWVSAYTDEAGWVDNALYFNSKRWTLLDPTLASYAKNGLITFTGDRIRYIAKYYY